MKLFSLLLLVGIALGAPTSNEDDKIVVTSQFFPKELSIYKAEHDIVNLYLPVNVDEESEETESDDDDIQLFFVLGDKIGDKIDYKGLYVRIDDKITKILDNGVDITSAKNDAKTIYIGATDGIYKYDIKKNATEKYGSLTDSVINIAKPNKADLIYVLTEDKTLYKVTDGGNTKTKIDNVKDAQQIVLDSSDTLYYYDNHKKIYTVNEHGVKEFTGLPDSITEITLLRPPFIIDDSIPAILNDDTFIIHANGTLESGDFKLRVKPTAYSVEGTLIQYYAYNKNIYEYNILLILIGDLLEDLKNFFASKQDTINSIASQRKSEAKL